MAITAVAFYGAGELISVLSQAEFDSLASVGAIDPYVTGYNISAVACGGIHAGAGAIAGGLSSAINHGNVGLGMLTGAISAGVAKFAGSFIENEAWGIQFAGRSAIGATTGGITSSVYGGNFWKGFVRGGEIAVAAFIFNDNWERLCSMARRAFLGNATGVIGGAGVAGTGGVVTALGVAESVESGGFLAWQGLHAAATGVQQLYAGGFMMWHFAMETLGSISDIDKYCPVRRYDPMPNSD